jgi:hypothetical protein
MKIATQATRVPTFTKNVKVGQPPETTGAAGGTYGVISNTTP